MSCSKYERKLIIVGKTGNGKSSLGNVLLGRHAFKEEHSFDADTKKCKMERNKGNVSVVDTPGLFDCNKEKGLAMQALEIQKAIKVCPNPHAILIVLNGSCRLTQEELSTIDVLRIIFGKQCLEKAIIVLTHLQNTVDERKLREKLGQSSEMSALITQCGGRYARIDNTEPNPAHINRIKTLVDQVSRSGKDNFDNHLLYVHGNVLQEAVKRHDSGPFHEQVTRLSEQIKTAVEEEQFYRNCLKVAGVGTVCVAAGAAFYAGGVRAVATAVSNPQKVIENTATELIRSVSPGP